ncbi:MAG: hypothetical protein VX210_07065 [Myxococcota bacterium]|nr:hypothetical protein [Myxococcota bacterium]
MTQDFDIEEYPLEDFNSMRSKFLEFGRPEFVQFEGEDHQLAIGERFLDFHSGLGKVLCLVAKHQDVPAGFAIITKRRLVAPNGQTTDPFWQFNAFHVAPEFADAPVPEAIFENRFPYHYFRCPRAYMLSVDGPDGNNTLAERMSKFPMVSFKRASILGYYLLAPDLARELHSTFRRHRGRLSYRSAPNVRELINPQTGLTMQLRHYQHGPCAVRGESEPSPGGVYAFMSPLEDPISRELELNGITPAATITVIHHRMEDWRWQFLLSNEV